MIRILTVGALTGSLLVPLVFSSVHAADAPAKRSDGVDLVIELGAGGQVQPRYPGASDLLFSPYPIVSMSYLRLPGLFELGGGPKTAFSIGPSFRVIGERDPADEPGLAGTRKLDATYEAGIKAGYEFNFDPIYGAEVIGEVRGAFGEASGVVGTVGADVIARPMPMLELRLGPRANLASSDYMGTYFSVSPGESAASGGRLDAYDAGGGLYSVGLKASARYEFKPTWFLNANAGYERFVGDAKDSPIVASVGDANQFTFGVGLSKQFSLDLFRD
ncbi:MipA/OmpV family protein [Kaistia adipata]|uniref:MipA/OmpV family protein n=1 Tax=Kaistia adipata TaxID=166954 RepID=UPI000400C8EF|nr:MipA/OmpV family protein [Kaistia adipata]